MRPKSTSRRRTRSIALIAGVCAALATGPVASAGAAPAPSTARTQCSLGWSTRWSVAPGMAPGSQLAVLVPRGIRTGKHRCYDRVVFDVTAQVLRGDRMVPAPRQAVPTLSAGYESDPFRAACGCAEGVPHAPGSALVIHSFLTPLGAKPSTDPRSKLTGYRSLRQILDLGSYRGDTRTVVMVPGALPFRAFLLKDAGGRWRLVVDVEHPR